MIELDWLRQLLLSLVALAFGLLALRTLIQPTAVAAELGYELRPPNGYSELFAIYVGLWGATAALAVYAAVNVGEPGLGDIVALLILAQPVGRVLAVPRYGWPQGALAGFFMLELAGGGALLLVRS
jgi:hypothetical protein